MAKFISNALKTMVVEGDSMTPTYNRGDWLLGRWSTFAATQLRPGMVVVIERSEQPGIFYVKRISEISTRKDGHGEIYLLSDNPKGTDSRQWGWLPISDVRARILFRTRRARKSS
jgi:signal peptidase I